MLLLFLAEYINIQNFQYTQSIDYQQGHEPGLAVVMGGAPERSAFPVNRPDH